MESKIILSLNNIKKSFGKTKVLEGINLDIKHGELIGLIGPSGSGKSTIMKILLGIQHKDSGTIMYNQKKVKNLKKIKSKIGYCTQDNAFYKKLTVKENLIFFGKLYGIRGKKLTAAVDELIILMKLPKNKVAESLSGGMKRRLDLAISLVHNPEVIILDEPTTGLDPILRKDIWNLIRRISDMGKTIIIASHMLTEIENNCHRIALLAEGKIQAVEDPRKIKVDYPGINSLEEFFTQVVCHVS